MSSKGRRVPVGGLSRELAVALNGSVEAAKDAAVLEAEAAKDAAVLEAAASAADDWGDEQLPDALFSPSRREAARFTRLLS